MTGNKIVLEHGDVVLEGGVVPGGVVMISGGKIAYAGPRNGLSEREKERALRLDVDGRLICPALVELHIHGCGEHSFHDPAEGHLAGVGRFLASRGVGYFLPTMTPDETCLSAVAEQLADLELGKRIPGIYVEGPFIARDKRGGIAENLVSAPSASHLRRIWELCRGRLAMMTLAPELQGASGMIALLRSLGALPAFGHSEATLDDMDRLTGEGGLSPGPDNRLAITHLFNAMSGLSHKQPGLALWALLDREVYTELNGDGTHVHPAAMELALRMRPPEKMILISDAVVSAGRDSDEDGDFRYSGRKTVTRGGGVYYADSGILVGSRQLIKDVVAGTVKTLGVPLHSCVGMASTNPLRMLGIEGTGALRAGLDADIAVFDRAWHTCYLLLFKGRPLHSLFRELPQGERP